MVHVAMARGSSFRSSLRGDRRFGNGSLTDPPLNNSPPTVPYQLLSPESSTCDPSSLTSGSQYADSTCYETEGSSELQTYPGTAHTILSDSSFSSLSKNPRLSEMQLWDTFETPSNPLQQYLTTPDIHHPRVASSRKASTAEILFSFGKKLSDGSFGIFRKLSDGSEAFVRKLSTGSTEIARKLSDGPIGPLRRILPKSGEHRSPRSSTASKSVVTPDVGLQAEKPKRGRRPSGKPLSPEKRKNFAQVRKLGVCICCKRNRTQCSERQPCYQCSEKNIPCERIDKERLVMQNIDKVMSTWDSELRAMVEASKIYAVGGIRLLGRLDIPGSATSQSSKLPYTQQVELTASLRNRHNTYGLNDGHMNAFMQKLPEIFEMPGVPSWAEVSEDSIYVRARECAGYYVLLQSLLYKDANIICLFYDQIKDYNILLTFATSLITWTTNKLVESVKSIIKEAIKSLLKNNHRKDSELLALALVTAIYSHGSTLANTLPRTCYLSTLQTQLKLACESDLTELERLGRCFFVNNFNNVKGKKKENKSKPREDFDELVRHLRSKLPFISLNVSYENDSARFGVDARNCDANPEPSHLRQTTMMNLNLHSYKPESYPKNSFWDLFTDIDELFNFGLYNDDSNGYLMNKDPLSLDDYHGFETPSSGASETRRESVHVGPCNESDQPTGLGNFKLNNSPIDARTNYLNSQILTTPSVPGVPARGHVPLREGNKRSRKRERIPSIEERPEESESSPISHHPPSRLCAGIVNEGELLLL